MKYKVIAIDGPAGSGKSTTAKILATKLGYTYLDTGAMYRTITLAALENKIDLSDESNICKLAEKVKFDIISGNDGDKIILDGRDVTAAIRTPKVDSSVSLVSSYKKVRERMVTWQRKYSKQGNVIAEGRDIGTVVFPDADLKIYLTADLNTRAVRRCRQLEGAGIVSNFDEQASALSSRDLFDSGRENSPLKKADDAIEFDTTDMSINEQVDKIYDLICQKLGIV